MFDLNKDHMVEMREFVTICALNDKLCGTRYAGMVLLLSKIIKLIFFSVVILYL